ncbi:MAG: 7-cyano-7-deazaguanine synthase [Thermoplasmatales archaeon]|nr:7-cyano-7-deazaguanine synthase [Thermoplasmatales archaeon]
MKTELEKLKKEIRQKEKILVCFSGGGDSAFLAKIAFDVLGKNAVAVTIDSETFPRKELKDAKNVASKIDIKHKIVSCSMLNNKRFAENTRNRCYYCKKEMMKTLKKIADEENIECAADGVTFSDYK